MRPYEIIFVSALFVTLLCTVWATTTSSAHINSLSRIALALLLLAGIALVLHVVLEGIHWQMYAAYLAILPAGWLVWSVTRSTRTTHWVATAAALLLLCVTCACSYVVPMFRLPAPTGAYAVGTDTLYLVDSSRMEDAGPQPGGKRELMVQLWYPAAAETGKFAPYRRRIETTFESSYQAVLPTHSRLNAAIAASDKPFPVLLFNPAWNGRRTQNTFLTEELASHGYVVAAIDHTYNSEPVAFPGGRVVWARHVASIETMENTTPAEVERAGTFEADKEAADDRFVLDELAKLNQQQGSPWHGTMNVTNAGAFGHSLGGAVSVETWATDERIRSAVNMDGWQFGTHSSNAGRNLHPSNATPAVTPGTQTPPLLFLYESLDNSFNAPKIANDPGRKWTPIDVGFAVSNWDAVNVTRLLERYGGYAFILQGSIHPTFIDKPITSPIARFSGRSQIDPRLAHRIIRDYIVQFFDQTLKGKPSPLLEQRQSSYPEMVTQMRVGIPESLPRP